MRKVRCAEGFDAARSSFRVSLEVWSPDGSQIAFIVSQHGESYVHVFDLVTGEDREVGPGEYIAWVGDGTLLVQEYLPGH